MLRDEIVGASDTEARGQLGPRVRFREGCTAAPGISRQSNCARSWHRQARCGRLLATAALVRGDAVPDGGVAGATDSVEAFPWDTAPTYLVCDNDGAYGQAFTRQVRAMGIRDRPIFPRSPWQNPYAEHLMGRSGVTVWIMS